MFCVGLGSTVNIDVFAAQRKHEKTPGIIRTMPFSVKMSLFCRCFMRGVKSPQIPTHNQRKENTKTLHFCSNLMWFCIYSRRFTRFGVGLENTVNCDTLSPQRKHEKTLDFYTKIQYFLSKCRCFLDVLCRAQKYCKYWRFCRAKKTRENTRNLCALCPFLSKCQCFVVVSCVV